MDIEEIEVIEKEFSELDKLKIEAIKIENEILKKYLKLEKIRKEEYKKLLEETEEILRKEKNYLEKKGYKLNDRVLLNYG